tara:strand:+ start:192 stop:470 length:279 start_codon:yes stop_codon:yes gene_type:complete
MVDIDEHQQTSTDIIVQRVFISPHTGVVSVIRFGLESVDVGPECTYKDVQELPSWVQTKLALLSMLSSTPPTPEIPGVGRRMDENTFWIYDR